jgi:tight adherence protein B
MRRAGLASLLSGAAIALACAPPAGAAQLHVSRAANVQFPARGLVLTLPVGAALSPSQVQVTENGKPVPGLSVTSSTATTSRHFGVVLAIDTSPRMRRSIDAAMAAARTFADHRNPHHPLAALTFNRSATSLVPLTYSHDRISAALAQAPALNTGRHLYDAVSAAIALLRHAHGINGSVVVISDGADKGSKLSAADVIAQARAGGIRIYTVGIDDDTGLDASSLQVLAAGTDADFVSGRTASQLTSELDQLGRRIASEYLVSYRSLAGPHQRVAVTVSVDGLGARTVRYTTPALGDYHGHALVDKRSFIRSTGAMVIVAFLIAVMVGIAVSLLLRGDAQNVRSRMAQFVPGPVDGVEKVDGTKAPKPSLRARVGTQPTADRWDKLKLDLEIARIAVSARHLVWWTAAGTILAFVLLLSASGSVALALLAVFVPVGVNAAIQRRLAQQRREFGDQLADTLQVVASALRIGHGFSGALAVAVEESSEPTRSELERVLVDEQLGIPLEDGLTTLAERMDSTDVSQLALVATVQRATGGNTAEVVDRVTESIRERGELRRLVESLTAQGRLSRWILTFLPIVVFLLLEAINPGYMDPLVHTGSGHALLALCIALVVSGSLVIKRIVEIKV